MENSKAQPLGNKEKQEILHQHKSTAEGAITSSLPLTILTCLPVTVTLLGNCQEIKKKQNTKPTTPTHNK